MKVNDQTLSTSYAPQTSGTKDLQRVQGGLTNRSGGPGVDSNSDRVEVSDLAETLSNVLSVAAEQRTSRVEQLASAVQSGTYKVDAAELSRSIIDQSMADPRTASLE